VIRGEKHFKVTRDEKHLIKMLVEKKFCRGRNTW